MAAQDDFCLFLNFFSVWLAIRSLKIDTYVWIKVLVTYLRYSGLNLHLLGSRQTFFTPRWAVHLCFLCQECDARGAMCWGCSDTWITLVWFFFGGGGRGGQYGHINRGKHCWAYYGTRTWNERVRTQPFRFSFMPFIPPKCKLRSWNHLVGSLQGCVMPRQFQNSEHYMWHLHLRVGRFSSKMSSDDYLKMRFRAGARNASLSVQNRRKKEYTTVK